MRRRAVRSAAWLCMGLALLAGAVAARAQSNVYSLNVVGYVNLDLRSGYSFAANVLDMDGTGTNNCITNLFPLAPLGTRVYVWNAALQAFDPPATYFSNSVACGWDRTSLDLSPGKGFVIYSPLRWTNTLVGNVLQGRLKTFIPGGNKLSLLGYPVPLGGSLSADLQFPTIDGAELHLFDNSSQSFREVVSCFGAYGYFDPSGAVAVQGPNLNLCESFFVRNPGQDIFWISDFYVMGPAPVILIGAPRIASLNLQTPGQVTLKVSQLGSYTVQYSTDRSTWTPVGSIVNSTLWTGPRPAAQKGFYRLTL